MRYLERFFRYVFWAVMTAAVAWIVKKAFERAAASQNANVRGHVPTNGPMQRPKALVRDPVCGTYVAEDISYSLMRGSESLHFCSQNCMSITKRPID